MSDDARAIQFRTNLLRGAVALFVLWVGFLLTLVMTSSEKPPTAPGVNANP